MQGFMLYYGSQHCGFLWISSALVHSLTEVLLIISPSQLTLYYSEWVSLLNFWQCSFISRHQISIIVAPSEGLYTAERQRCLSPEFTVQSIWGEQLIVIHILIGIILILIFLCSHFTPYRNCEDAIFYKVDGV